MVGRFATIDGLTRDPDLGATFVPTATPTPGIKLQTDVYHDGECVDQAFRKAFDDRNLLIDRTSASGTQPTYFFVQQR